MTTKTSKILSLIRPHFHDMEGYNSAGMDFAKDDTTLFLNANENPYELDGLEGCNRYPQPQPQNLTKALADLYGVKPENLLITRGADEGIAILTRSFVEPHKDTILINPPTFGVYKTYAQTMPAKDIIQVPLLKTDGTFKLDVGGIKTALNGDHPPKLIYITNPNNPTGNVFDKGDILEIIKAAANKAAVVLDETYADFVEDCSLLNRLKDFPHLIILRTLSKSYSFAGMRVGVILSGETELIDTIRAKIMEVYPIPVATVGAAMKVLSPATLKTAKDNIAKLLSERIRLENFLKAQSYATHIFPSDVNFLMVEMQRPTEFYNFAAKNNVILRDFSSKPLTENCLRISIGTPDQNDIVMNLMKEFYG